MPETVMITGASGGIGEAIATLFAKDRCRLILVARSGGRLEEVAQGYRESFGVEVHTMPADLSDPDAVESLAAQLRKKGLKIDVLVINAGYGLNGPAIEMDRERQLGIIDLNVRALADLTLRFLPDMVARGSGGIMQIASIAGLTPGPYMAVYYASKAFVLSFSEAITKETEGSGVTITTVLPGLTDTNFARRASMDERMARTAHAMEPEDVAEEAYRAFRAGRRQVITGFPNRLLAASTRLFPLRARLAIVRRLHEKR